MEQTFYDDPDFLIIRQERKQGLFSANAAQTAFVGGSLKLYRKALVLGCTFVVQSGGSVAGTRTVAIYRNTSLMQSARATVSVGASAIGKIFDISMSTGFTLSSMGQVAKLMQDVAATSALADEKFVLQDIIWRYRLLPF